MTAMARASIATGFKRRHQRRREVRARRRHERRAQPDAGGDAGEADVSPSSAASPSMRAREAPSARLTPTSRRRCPSCTVRSAATLRHSTTNTSATAPRAAGRRVSRRRPRRRAAASSPTCRRARRRARGPGASPRARASWRGRWPNRTIGLGRAVARAGGGAAKSRGRQSTVSHAGKRNDAGRMPTTSTRSSPTAIRRPTIPGSPPKAPRHSVSESSTRSSAPARPSPGTNRRPAIGRTPPRSGKRSGVTHAIGRGWRPSVAPVIARGVGVRRRHGGKRAALLPGGEDGRRHQVGGAVRVTGEHVGERLRVRGRAPAGGRARRRRRTSVGGRAPAPASPPTPQPEPAGGNPAGHRNQHGSHAPPISAHDGVAPPDPGAGDHCSW